MNANIRTGHRHLTATQVLAGVRTARAAKAEASVLVRIGRGLIAPAVVAVLMLGAHAGAFRMASAAEALAMEDGGVEQYFPAEYAFRAADFDDPSNYR